MIPLDSVCAVCGETYGEHHVDGHCPIFARFDTDYLAGFHPRFTFTSDRW